MNRSRCLPVGIARVTVALLFAHATGWAAEAAFGELVVTNDLVMEK